MEGLDAAKRHPKTGYDLIKNEKRIMRRRQGSQLFQKSGAGKNNAHIGGNRLDNDPDNLVVMLKTEHDRLPKLPRKPIKCPHCGGLIEVARKAKKRRE